MPTFPRTGVEAALAALYRVGLTPERVQKIDKIEAADLHLQPISDTLQVTADGQEYTVVDTSQLAIVNNLPHGIAGWIDVSDFVSKVTDPNASITVKWIIDGRVVYQDTFYLSDFTEEPYIYFLERRAIRYHKITITLNNSGASDTNPINFEFAFDIRAGLLPIPP